MNGGRCSGCSESIQRDCHCGRVPTNLTFVQSILNKPTNRRRKCARKCTNCVVMAAGGNSVDCLCGIDNDAHTQSDHRLKCWERELELRNNIAERLMQRTGKSFCELLFNRPVTVDVRDKLMLQRLLAHAESRKPKARHNKAVLKEQLPGGCCIMEISSAKTTPKKYFEISGLPAGVKCELIGENCCVRRSGWLNSRAVQQHIAAKGNDIKRVLPFFPDIEYLQVIGQKANIYICNENDEAEQSDCCSCCSPGSTTSETCCEMNENICQFDTCLCDEIDEIVEEENQLPGQLGCTDSDLDYCRELICNRAKCHELFYRF